MPAPTFDHISPRLRIDESFRRFYVGVLEDRERLADLHGDGDGYAYKRFTALGAYFR